MDRDDKDTSTIDSRLASLSLGASHGQRVARVQGSVASNGTWLANQQRKATYQPFQPRPVKAPAPTSADTSTTSSARAPLSSRQALGNVHASDAAADATTGPKARAPSLSGARKVPAAAAHARRTSVQTHVKNDVSVFDLGQYDGGLERDEGKGRRDTAAIADRAGYGDGDLLAMDSSMDG